MDFYGKISKIMVRTGMALFFVMSCAVVVVSKGCRYRETDLTLETSGVVRSVLDGDTIELVDGRKVRYVGIDTPETRKYVNGSWQFSPEPYGVRATDRNKELVLGKRVRIETDVEKEDRFGRTLAYVYTGDGKMVNEILVSEGLATVYTFPPNMRYYTIFTGSQQNAMSSGTGLWADIPSISPEDMDSLEGRFCHMSVTVQDIMISDRKVILIFSGKGEDLYRAVMPRGNIRLFTDKGIDPFRDFPGKKVEITGKIRVKNGPVITIDNPLQIKVLEGE